MGACLLIVNPEAGGGRAAEQAARLASERRQPGAGPPARPAPGGGDGPPSEAATGLLAAGQLATDFALLPFGTGNDFGRTIGVADWQAGVASLTADRWRTVDAIEVRYQS